MRLATLRTGLGETRAVTITDGIATTGATVQPEHRARSTARRTSHPRIGTRSYRAPAR
jgi:hypothetical protein